MQQKRGVGSSIVHIVLTVLVIAIAYYFLLPPINIHSKEFWEFLILCLIIIGIVNCFRMLEMIISNVSHTGHFVLKDLASGGKTLAVLIIAGILIIGFLFVGTFIGSTFFHANAYHNIIAVENGDFVEDVSELSRTQIPVVDRDTAERLGSRKLGEMSDLVSQFTIDNYYTQINYQGRPYRVTPLTYGDPVKWFYNQSDGIPAYIMVDMVTQETKLIRLEEGIKYSPDEYFFRDLYRHMRLSYPTLIFDNITFEVDDNGTPYWVASVVEYRIGVWSGKDYSGIVLVNAQTGETAHYDLEEVPTWIDQVFSAEVVLTQMNYYGAYGSGFINSIIGQKGVLQTTDGYNYLAINDDVYLYTGMTSVMSDESNVGFVLVNLRTKETKYYSVPGAEEYSAMSSAEGQVQHLGYTSTFPLLLNVADRPTYFMSLKDDAGLVKMYAFVDVEQYQIVATGSSINEAQQEYIKRLKDEDVDIGESTVDLLEVTGTVADISSVVIDGNTIYYIMLKNDTNVYTAVVTISERLPFVKAGDNVIMQYTEQENVREVSAFALK
ncbi:MAG: CvpA family protein [Lachnospiraceae bacterium]